jgi:hypothetical protein
MHTYNYRDILGGGLLILIGLFVSITALIDYDLGTMRHMGPGMFPAWLGFILAGFGGLILVLGLLRPGERIEVDYRQFAAVILGLIAFAFTVGLFGMIPAVVVLTIGAVLADNKLGVVGTVILAAVLSIIAVVIFRIGLSISLELFKWPF